MMKGRTPCLVSKSKVRLQLNRPPLVASDENAAKSVSPLVRIRPISNSNSTFKKLNQGTAMERDASRRRLFTVNGTALKI
jgi:hypothetical protein